MVDTGDPGGMNVKEKPRSIDDLYLLVESQSAQLTAQTQRFNVMSAVLCQMGRVLGGLSPDLLQLLESQVRIAPLIAQRYANQTFKSHPVECCSVTAHTGDVPSQKTVRDVLDQRPQCATKTTVEPETAKSDVSPATKATPKTVTPTSARSIKTGSEMNTSQPKPQGQEACGAATASTVDSPATSGPETHVTETLRPSVTQLEGSPTPNTLSPLPAFTLAPAVAPVTGKMSIWSMKKKPKMENKTPATPPQVMPSDKPQMSNVHEPTSAEVVTPTAPAPQKTPAKTVGNPGVPPVRAHVAAPEAIVEDFSAAVERSDKPQTAPVAAPMASRNVAVIPPSAAEIQTNIDEDMYGGDEIRPYGEEMLVASHHMSGCGCEEVCTGFSRKLREVSLGAPTFPVTSRSSTIPGLSKQSSISTLESYSPMPDQGFSYSSGFRPSSFRPGFRSTSPSTAMSFPVSQATTLSSPIDVESQIVKIETPISSSESARAYLPQVNPAQREEQLELVVEIGDGDVELRDNIEMAGGEVENLENISVSDGPEMKEEDVEMPDGDIERPQNVTRANEEEKPENVEMPDAVTEPSARVNGTKTVLDHFPETPPTLQEEKMNDAPLLPPSQDTVMGEALSDIQPTYGLRLCEPIIAEADAMDVCEDSPSTTTPLAPERLNKPSARHTNTASPPVVSMCDAEKMQKGFSQAADKPQHATSTVPERTAGTRNAQQGQRNADAAHLYKGDKKSISPQTETGEVIIAQQDEDMNPVTQRKKQEFVQQIHAIMDSPNRCPRRSPKALDEQVERLSKAAWPTCAPREFLNVLAEHVGALESSAYGSAGLWQHDTHGFHAVFIYHAAKYFGEIFGPDQWSLGLGQFKGLISSDPGCHNFARFLVGVNIRIELQLNSELLLPAPKSNQQDFWPDRKASVAKLFTAWFILSKAAGSSGILCWEDVRGPVLSWCIAAELKSLDGVVVAYVTEGIGSINKKLLLSKKWPETKKAIAKAKVEAEARAKAERRLKEMVEKARSEELRNRNRPMFATEPSRTITYTLSESASVIFAKAAPITEDMLPEARFISQFFKLFQDLDKMYLVHRGCNPYLVPDGYKLDTLSLHSGIGPHLLLESKDRWTGNDREILANVQAVLGNQDMLVWLGLVAAAKCRMMAKNAKAWVIPPQYSSKNMYVSSNVAMLRIRFVQDVFAALCEANSKADYTVAAGSVPKALSIEQLHKVARSWAVQCELNTLDWVYWYAIDPSSASADTSAFTAYGKEKDRVIDEIHTNGANDIKQLLRSAYGGGNKRPYHSDIVYDGTNEFGVRKRLRLNVCPEEEYAFIYASTKIASGSVAQTESLKQATQLETGDDTGGGLYMKVSCRRRGQKSALIGWMWSQRQLTGIEFQAMFVKYVQLTLRLCVTWANILRDILLVVFAQAILTLR
ncbi:hypothetical protein P154DRAFT_539787 [Amniculicola lignicola CBS 123094]|uniref:Uncharacterized protein n=1 Tax=Amniculicola lignicola CBS 123094 TaxID=1392246 RepID=A0A6A5VXD7_9PLEO|nr:hypothetical protein P154DRAFT_539787 [Amniculicola lignicola CBS 123094]